MNLSVSRDTCLNLERSLRMEYLETNGRGGYAASTVLDCHTRKYHGLLVAPLSEPSGRHLLLSKLELVLRVNQSVFQLSTNKYPGVFNPTGHKYVEGFACEPYPVTDYRIGDIHFRRSLLMPQGEDSVFVRLELVAAEQPITLQASPLLAYRDIHQLTRENMYVQVKTFPAEHGEKVHPYGSMPPLYMTMGEHAAFHPGPHWMYNLEYLKERSRGYEYQEDLFCPGMYEQVLNAGDVVYFRAGLTPNTNDIAARWEKEEKRRRKGAAKDELSVLKRDGAKFIVTKDKKTGIVAGYPWFGQWSRDTMIALPGLTVYSGRPKQALDVLKTYAGYEQNGLLPNYLSDTGDAHAFNSVDAAMWYGRALQHYVEATGDHKGIKKPLEALGRIIAAVFEHRVPNLQLRDNGLVAAGDSGTQLTWMDAAVHGQPVTPRHGMAVEVNALWYNSLCVFQALSKAAGAKVDAQVGKTIKAIKQSFIRTFWLEDMGYLADVVNEAGWDSAVRPNQVVAAALPYSPLSKAKKKSVLDVVQRELLTPYGLRTLSPKNEAYRSAYSGDPATRDSAYHQGIVWPWLLGSYVDLALQTARNRKSTAKKLLAYFAPLWEDHNREVCLGSISEIFTGNAPHQPKGCPAQAWSVGELIRACELLNKELEP